MKELWSTRPCFDMDTWQDGYARGYFDGHRDGEHLGEQALRDRLLRHLALVRQDLCLRLLHDLETPEQLLPAVELVIEDQRDG